MWLALLAPLACVLLMGFVIRRGGSAGLKETLASQSRKNASLLPPDEVEWSALARCDAPYDVASGLSSSNRGALAAHPGKKYLARTFHTYLNR